MVKPEVMGGLKNENLSQILSANKISMATTKNQLNQVVKKHLSPTRISHASPMRSKNMHRVSNAAKSITKQNTEVSRYRTVSPEHSNRDIDDILSQEVLPGSRDDYINSEDELKDSAIDLVEQYPIVKSSKFFIHKKHDALLNESLTNTPLVLPDLYQYQVTGPVYGEAEDSYRPSDKEILHLDEKTGSAWQAMSAQDVTQDRPDSILLLQQTASAELEANLIQKYDVEEQTVRTYRQCVTTEALPNVL